MYHFFWGGGVLFTLRDHIVPYFNVLHATFSLDLFIEPKFPKSEKFKDAFKTHRYEILRIFECPKE